MTPTRLFAVRHAPTEAEGICYGQTEVPLTHSHADAAGEMREALSGVSVDGVWASDLPRCREPASLLAASLEVPLRVTEALRELSMGEWEGRAWDDLEREDHARVHRWMSAWQTEAPPGGETLPAFESRVRRWHAELSNEPSVVVAHAGVVRCLEVIRRGRPWSDAMALPVPHLALVRL
ncbi:MAG: histidine phosphatase family protein [Myxococcota bacterium]